MLREIDLSENKLTGIIPPEISRLTRLQFLNLLQNRLLVRCSILINCVCMGNSRIHVRWHPRPKIILPCTDEKDVEENCRYNESMPREKTTPTLSQFASMKIFKILIQAVAFFTSASGTQIFDDRPPIST
jgi:hypothetical protein